MTRALVVIALVVAGCRPMRSIYTQGPPRRVQVDKQVSEPVVLAEGVRDPDGGATVRVLELYEVRVTRRAHHGALEVRVEHPGHPLWELIEIPVGLAMLVSIPVLATWNVVGIAGDKRGTRQTPVRPFLAMADPTRTIFAGKLRTHVARDVEFEGAPRIRQYNVRLPVGELALRYRVLDAGRDVLARGEVTTDPFGKLRIPEVPAAAVGIELVGEGVQTIAPLSGPSPAPEPPPTPVVPPAT